MLEVREPCYPGVQESNRSLCSATKFLVGSGTVTGRLEHNFLGLKPLFPAVTPQSSSPPSRLSMHLFDFSLFKELLQP